MKMYILLIGFILSVSSFAQTGIYLSTGTRYDVSDIESIMDDVLMHNTTRRINIFVHGRGKHPEKGLGVMSELENMYGVSSIMFHWPSWKSAVERPVGNAISSSEDLYVFLNALNNYISEHPFKTFGLKFSLLVHSMGNIVFKEMIQNHYSSGSFKYNLFDTLILNAADVPVRDHQSWVDKIDFSKENFITYNDNDIVLFGSEQLDRFSDDFEEYEGTRLGKNVDKAVKKSNEERSNNAKYLNISKLTFTGHRHFITDLKKKNRELRSIFSRLIKGRRPYLNKRDGVYKVRENVYYFKHD